MMRGIVTRTEGAAMAGPPAPAPRGGADERYEWGATAGAQPGMAHPEREGR